MIGLQQYKYPTLSGSTPWSRLSAHYRGYLPFNAPTGASSSLLLLPSFAFFPTPFFFDPVFAAAFALLPPPLAFGLFFALASSLF